MPIPVVTARSGGEQVTDSTTHVITLPSFSVGNMLLVIIAIDARVTTTVSSGSGWNQLGRIPNGVTTLAVYWKIASGTGDNLTLTTDSSQQSTHNSFTITGAYFVDGNPSQTTSGAINSIIPSDRYDADYLSIITQCANGVVSITAPAGYSNTVLRTPAGADGSTLFTAEQGFSNISTSIASSTLTGTNIPLTFNLPNIHLAISECDPSVHGHPRVFSRDTTDLSLTTQTQHPIRMPPNIEVGDLIMVHFACSGNTSAFVNTTASGLKWTSTDGAESVGASPTSGVWWKVAEATNALTIETGTAQKSHTITVCIKGWSRIIENGDIGNFYRYVGGSGLYDPDDNPIVPTWKKLLFIRSFASANSTWFSPATNSFTGFPENASGSGASINYGDRGLALDDGINWGSYDLTNNALFWHYQIEGYDINTVEFVGWDGLVFAGTSSGQNITISSVTDINGNTVSIRSGDLVLVGFASGSTADRALNVSSSGWTQIDTKRYVNGTTYDVNMGLWYKIMGDTPDTTVSVTGTLNNADAGAVNIAVYRGVDQTDPIDGVAFTSGTGTTLPAPLPLEYGRSGGLPIQYVAMAAAGTGTLIPGSNYYYIQQNSTDTNSISTTMNHDVPDSIKRFRPLSFTGGPTAAAGNSWGAYTLNLKPRRNIANTYIWRHEAGTANDAAFYSTSQVLYTSQTGQKGSRCIRMLPNNYSAIRYTEQIAAKKFWVQARVNIVVTQNPTANSYIGLFGLHNYWDANSEYQSFTVQAEIKTDGRIFFALRHQANSLIIPSNTAYSSNTWNYLAFLCDYSAFGQTPMTFKVNNVEVGTADIYPSMWKPHILVGKTYEESTQGSRNWNGFVYLDNMQYSANGWPDYPTGRPKVYNGSTWVNKPLKRWNGSAWVEEPMTYYNGTNWEYIT